MTPLIHLNILISATSNFFSCAFFIAQVDTVHHCWSYNCVVYFPLDSNLFFGRTESPTLHQYTVLLFLVLGGCPLSGKSSMCMMCLKYRIILLIVIKNPWVILLTYFLLRGAAPYLAGALTAPLRPFDIPIFSSASTVSPSSDYT